MDRKDIGSWLQGPKAALADQGIDLGYPGERLGLPKTGVGAIAGTGRRLVALSVDWLTSNLIVNAFFTEFGFGTQAFRLITLAVFAIQVGFFTTILGSSFGQQLFGIGIRDLSGRKPSPVQSLLRTMLLTLAVPALIWDRDTRGFHDKAAKTVAVRTR